MRRLPAKTQTRHANQIVQHPNSTDLSATRIPIHYAIYSLEISRNENPELLERDVD
jgi:hypothetical protein